MKCPIIDTHQHLVYPEKSGYFWTKGIPQLEARAFRYDDYLGEIEGTRIAATIFVETAADSWREETQYIYKLAAHPNSLIVGIVAHCRPEEEGFEDYIESIRHPKLAGLRRICHVEQNDFALHPRFVENVRRLGKHALTFDLCFLARQLPAALELAQACPDVQFILDHCGVPDIAGGKLDPWRQDIHNLARLPNVACKISGLLAYCRPDNATIDAVRPYVAHSISCFGWDRLVWGGDWPVCNLATSLRQWVSVSRELVRDAAEADQRRFFHENAQRIYGLKNREMARDASLRAFTLIETLVSTTILVLLMLLFAAMVSRTGSAWNYTESKIEQFRNARAGFESMSRHLSQATLNTYWDYDSTVTPKTYLRQSELRFVSGPNLAGTITSTPPRPTHSIFFQAPLGFVVPANSSDTTYSSYTGLNNILNTWGYYIEFNNEDAVKPSFIATPSRYRFRLMEMMQPSQALSIYNYTSGLTSGGTPKTLSYTGMDWFLNPMGSTTPPVHVLAENIVALVLLPKLTPVAQNAGGYNNASLAPNYLYDSTGTGMTTLSDANLNPKSQLPPIVQVTMVAVDETSYSRYQSKQATTSMPPLYDATLFTNASNYDTDLQKLQISLQTNNLNYCLFTTDVAIKGAKWSTSQTQ